MFKRLATSANAKLYLLIATMGGLIVLFVFFYSIDYFKYYNDLRIFRNNLVSYLSTQDYTKPVYNQGDPVIGNLNSKIIIFEYGDFACESCKLIQPVIQQLFDFYGQDKMAVIWKDFPINSTKDNFLTHQAAHCANDQGKFAEYATEIFANQGNINQESLITIAGKTGLNLEVFNKCLSSSEYQTVVENNYRTALQAGLDSAPVLYINNRQVDTGYSFENLRNIIESTK